jgi:radical SAM/Cys-rich protein
MPQDRVSDENTLESQGALTCRIEPFAVTLGKQGLELKRDQTDTLQINLGLLCNQACLHCHLKAGPDRSEVMDRETIKAVVAYAERARFHTVDITGGAPEMNPYLGDLIEKISPAASRLMLRTNLTALAESSTDHLLGVCKAHHVVIMASLPSLNASQTDSQRGNNVFSKSVAMLRKLNKFGYGRNGTRLELNIVSNPTGAFLSAPQSQAQQRFKDIFERRWSITFNNLYLFANVPLGRFRDWLVTSGNYHQYIHKLASGFNPCTVDGLMCRTLVSVSWDGYLYDCDFNLAAQIPIGGLRRHVSEAQSRPSQGAPIAVSDHCYACTAGSGFT